MLVGDTDGFQGTLLLMQEILERYPHVAIETEQFNMLTAQFGKLVLSQMPLGHSLSGYIFRKFVKVVPEGVMYSPTDVPLMDAFASWGFMLPGANVGNDESRLQIVEAYHRFGLRPDARLPRTPIRNHVGRRVGTLQAGPLGEGGKAGKESQEGRSEERVESLLVGLGVKRWLGDVGQGFRAVCVAERVLRVALVLSFRASGLAAYGESRPRNLPAPGELRARQRKRAHSCATEGQFVLPCLVLKRLW